MSLERPKLLKDKRELAKRNEWRSAFSGWD